MNTDNGNDDLELTQLVDQRIDAAAEDHSNSREREHQHLGNGPPSEILVALDPRSSTKSSDENDGFDLMEIVAQRAADARATIDSEQTDSEQTETLVQPGAYAVNGVTSRPQEEDEPSVDNDEEPLGPHKAGESWEEDDIQSVAHPIDHQGSEEMLPSEVPLIAVARPIDHQGLEELLPSGVPFIARNRTVWNRKLWCYVSLEFFVGMLIVTTFLLYKTIDLPNATLMNGCWRTERRFKPIPIGG
ncbi:expressed unknown protein [Seminavis robusta]|uniref:Uncharacterized protein n=1 Tax=Seminavis robusta TaxID=568900 RepID=A0A9N8H3G4_9STRA|nr:expressed unknown protein [Seminavis robusta]|eukprot:Sro59_g034450.1 n/a (245) ;mRNA; r:141736-142642